ncbi:MAG: hypothetical protein AVDCRST_MAG31-258, partial [uncultured Sphingomonas sp.]
DRPHSLLPLRPASRHGDRRARARVGLPLPELQKAQRRRLRGAGALARGSGDCRGSLEHLRDGGREREPGHLPLLPGLRVGRVLPERGPKRPSQARRLGGHPARRLRRPVRLHPGLLRLGGAQARLGRDHGRGRAPPL